MNAPATPFQLSNHAGLPLRGHVQAPAGSGPHPVVVVCHGFKGFKNWGFFPYVGESLARAGFTSVLFNFSGSGIGPDLENFTELDRFAADTMSAQLDDLGVVLDAIRRGEVAAGADPSRIGLLGHSRGGAAVLIRAREEPAVRAVVTWAGISHLLRASERELADWKERGFMEFVNARTHQTMRVDYTQIADVLQNRERFDLRRCMSDLRVPALIVHGEQDLSVAAAEAHELHAAADPARCELHIVPRTGHTFGAVHPWQGTTSALESALTRSIDWFRRHLGA
jgi:dienelactone hydrolase